MTAQDVSTLKAKPIDFGAVAKDLLGTAVVAMLILVPIISHKSVITQYSLVLETRWPTIALIMAVLLSVRLAMHLFVWNRAPKPVTTDHATPRTAFWTIDT